MFRQLIAGAVLAGAVGLAIPAHGAAQRSGEVYFEMLEDLEDFERHYLSKYSWLYDFGPFEERSKRWISAAELEELRAQWDRERARVAAELARLEDDPTLRSLYDVRRKVGKNAFFSDVDCEWVDAHAPFHYVVQRPPKDRPDYYERQAASYAPWAEALYELFQTEYVGPLELQPRADYRVFVTAVLGSEGAYDDYARRNKARNPAGQRAHYDARLRLAVTYEPWAGGAKTADERRHALMHELVHAFQHAYSAGPDGVPPHPWLNEGLADYLSSGSGSKPESLAEHPLDERARKMIADLLREEGARDVYVLPLEDLLDARSYGQVVRAVWRRARALRTVQFDSEYALSAFYRQAYLLVYWLEREGGDDVRRAFHAYLRAYFRGQGERAAFEQAFEDHDLARLEADYLRWIEPRAKGWRPARLAAAADAADESGELEPEPPTFDPELLRPATDAPECALAAATWEVLHGSPSAARARLAECAQELEEGDAWRPRIARELERISGWIGLRDRFLGWLAETGGKLAVEVERKGKLVSRRVPVAGIEDGCLRFGDNDYGLEERPLAALDPVDLVKQMISARGFEDDWSRLYIDVLGGRENWERKLPKDDPAADSLRRDAPDYPDLVHEGALLMRLGALADEGPPEDGPAAERALAALGALLEDAGQSPAVQRARPGLAALAELSALRAAESAGLDALLAGAVTDLGGGRVRIRYEFDAPEERDDFAPLEWRDSLPASAPAAAGQWSVRGGRLVGRGRACVRHAAGFEGAQTVRYSVRWGQVGAPADFGLLLCHDGGDGYVASLANGALLIVDPQSAEPQIVVGSEPLMAETDYGIELRHDGADAIEARAGKERLGPLRCGSLTGGDLVLFVNSVVPVELESLEIEATLRPDALDRARRAAARRRVEALGLGG